MKKPTIHQDISQEIPEDIRMIFEKTPLLKTENPAHYRQLVDLLIKAIKPVDVVDWLRSRTSRTTAGRSSAFSASGAYWLIWLAAVRLNRCCARCCLT